MAQPGSSGGCCAVVLAAGRGSRFGGDKLLAPFRGLPLLSHPLRVLAQVHGTGRIARIVAVVPSDSPKLAALASEFPVEVVLQPEHSPDQRSSLRLGLHAAASASRVLIALGDQPLLTAATIEALLLASDQHPASIIRPRFGNEPEVPGHPVIVPAQWWYLAGTGHGFRPGGPDGAPLVVVRLPGTNPDIDTQADLRFLEDSPE